jgi:hypothetical protein
MAIDTVIRSTVGIVKRLYMLNRVHIISCINTYTNNAHRCFNNSVLYLKFLRHVSA